MKTERDLRVLLREELGDALHRIRPIDPEPLPWDRAAERAACAAMLRGDRPPEWLRREHFWNPLHRAVFVSACHLRDADWDVTTVHILLGMQLEGWRADRWTAIDVEDLREDYAVTPWEELRARLVEKVRARRIVQELSEMVLRLRYSNATVDETVDRLRRLTRPQPERADNGRGDGDPE